MLNKLRIHFSVEKHLPHKCSSDNKRGAECVFYFYGLCVMYILN